MNAIPDLKQALQESLKYEQGAAALRAAETPQELVAAWWDECDWTEEPVHSLLFEIYREKVRKFGALQP